MDINNFVIKIDDRNREIIKNWWEKEFPSKENKAWSIGAHYGKERGESYVITYGLHPIPPVISFEEFTQYILNNDYQIY